VEGRSNWCSYQDPASLAGRTCVLITGMVQVTPATPVRPPATGRADPDWYPAPWPGPGTPAVAGIIRHDRPYGQPPAYAGYPANQGLWRGGSRAGQPGIRGGQADRRPQLAAGGTALTMRAGRPGTAHTPEVRQ
jgi:hypothetical protein